MGCRLGLGGHRLELHNALADDAGQVRREAVEPSINALEPSDDNVLGRAPAVPEWPCTGARQYPENAVDPQGLPTASRGACLGRDRNCAAPVVPASFGASAFAFSASAIACAKPRSSTSKEALAADPTSRSWMNYRFRLAYSLKGENERSVAAL